MKAIAKALVLASQYIQVRGPDYDDHDDLNQLEEIAFLLRDATPAEIKTLVDAAQELGFPNWPIEIGIG